MNNPASLEAAIAAHRFGLGEADLAVVGADPRAWLRAQIGPADTPVGEHLATGLEALHEQRDVIRQVIRNGGLPSPTAAEMDPAVQRRLAREKARASEAAEAGDGAKQAKRSKPGGEALRTAVEAVREIAVRDLQSRLQTAATSRRPFAERLALFWSNHFTVSQAAPAARGLAGAFEREAIRPHIAGRFEELLRASTLHPAMLRYLDNFRSIGPHSPLAQRAARPQVNKKLGLNENLAREILELHTLGAVSNRPGTAAAAGGYSQADVTEFARVLTGWTSAADPDARAPVVFDARRHEPGPKKLLGKTYPEGAAALDQVLHDLAEHPATARFVATKLARHFVADEPDAALVDRLAAAYSSSHGDLPTVYRALIDAPQAWAPAATKLRTPEEFALASARLLGQADRGFKRVPDGGIESMGQRLHWAPSPAGWSDRAEDWLGPDAVWKRIEWASGVAARVGAQADARQLARSALGARLSEETARQIERAADGPQALTLLLMSPEFQRR